MKLSEVLASRKKKSEEDGKGRVAAQKPAGAGSQKTLKVLRTRETPNPSALQFVLNGQVIDYGKKSFSNREECGGDSMCEALFDLEGIKNVYISENFVTITKDDFFGWNPLKDRVWERVNTHITFYETGGKVQASQIDTANYLALSQEDKLKAVEAVLDRSIRSNLAQDGGGVDVKGIEGNEVLIHYQGACGNCPSSTAGTLQFIEKQFKQQLDRDITVKSV